MRLPGDHKEVQEEPEESENRFPVSVPINVKALPPPEPPGGTPLAGSLLVVVRLITLVLAGWGVKLACLPTASTTYAPPLRGPGPARPLP